jgi:cytochrome P450
MAQAMLEDDATLPFQQSQLDMIKNVTGQAYLAGSDTTMATVLSFFLAMLVYPEVQAKAQAEVDRIVGTHRLPELADRMKLPYVQGVVNECLRWLPVTPLGHLQLLIIHRGS